MFDNETLLMTHFAHLENIKYILVPIFFQCQTIKEKHVVSM